MASSNETEPWFGQVYRQLIRDGWLKGEYGDEAYRATRDAWVAAGRPGSNFSAHGPSAWVVDWLEGYLGHKLTR